MHVILYFTSQAFLTFNFKASLTANVCFDSLFWFRVGPSITYGTQWSQVVISPGPLICLLCWAPQDLTAAPAVEGQLSRMLGPIKGPVPRSRGAMGTKQI